ncbi:Transposon TX1 uncharacterized 149 kDa protein, partial [Linum grandiflorum]
VGLSGLAWKLKTLKGLLKTWNKDCFGRVDKNIEKISKDILELDAIEESGQMTDEDRIRRCYLKSNLGQLWRMEEVCWRQKPTLLWLRVGDRNTSFFHRSANGKRRQNWIDKITINGRVYIGQEDVSEAISGYFENFFFDPLSSWRLLPWGLTFKRIYHLIVSSLTNVFTEEEVWSCIKSVNGDKSPDLDGFNMSFIKQCWYLIMKNVLGALEDFRSTSTIPQAINCSFICFIPKKDAIREIRDLRPISLIGITYKILSKFNF